MKLPITREGVCRDRGQSAARPVPRIKRSLATSLCAGSSASWSLVRRQGGPYHFNESCLCLSPEQHDAQFQRDGWELRSLKGHC